MRRFRVVGVKVGLDTAERVKGVFSTVILLKKLEKLLKLRRCNGLIQMLLNRSL